MNKYILAASLIATKIHAQSDTDIDLTEEEGWLERNPWVFAVLFMVVGPVIAGKGLKWLELSGVVLTGVFLGVLVMTEALDLGWADTSEGAWFLAFVCILIGVLAGAIVRNNLKLLVRLVAGICGWYLLRYVLAIFTVLSNSKVNGWWMYVFPGLMGGFMALRTRKPMNSQIIYMTSFVGTYIFCIAWVYFFPQVWPSANYEGEAKDISFVFWILVVLIAGGTVTSALVQRCDIDSDELDDDYLKPIVR